ncbi:MAG: SAM-dependent DNA methyltransferase [Candidatus Marinimicrobia bacterium]|nr:SAM-dependent DNA methyltransferase [Candidatus Neomarinimicrobiota bacterium]
MIKSTITSKKRVTDHGEVFTSEREVNAMLDLVKQETERIDSRFLEPACGDGNFLSEILNRKLKIVEGRYRKSQNELDKYSLVAITSIYGVELLEDNVERCKERLFKIYLDWYNSISRGQINEKLFNCVQFVLSKNIIHGDALTLKAIGESEEPIVFSEWSFTQNMLKRRCFAFDDLLKNEAIKETPLFSDLGDDVILPRTIEEFPLVHYLELADNA